MKIAKSAEELKNLRGEISGRVSFVPTMGALHEGHLSLIRLARKHADHVIVSLYVNPTQFAPHEDFDAYPRDIEGDCAMLEREGVALVYTPGEADIYPEGPQITVKAGTAAEGLEGAFRPHFFDGVCTVVHTLFEQVRPDVAVFGEKDFQQLQVIKEMVEVESLPIEIIGAPIMRDEHGLALSSRNAYLSAEEVAVARQLNVILQNTSSRWRAEGAGTNGIQKREPQNGSHMDPRRLSEAPPRRGDDILEEAKHTLLNAGFDKVDYVEKRWNRILAAAWLGKTRLIDNMQI